MTAGIRRRGITVGSFIRNGSFPLVAAWDGMRGLGRQLKALEESQYWPAARIAALQLDRLRQLLTHAYNCTAFYRKRFDECGFHPARLRNSDDIRVIPPLTKHDIRDHLNDLVSRDHRDEDLEESISGGTTGIHTRFRISRRCLAAKQASLLRFDQWAGWRIGDWMSVVWPPILDHPTAESWRARLKNAISYRKILLPLIAIDEALIAGHVREIAKRRPTVIRGFPTPLVELAKYVDSKGPALPFVRGIVSTGEALYPIQRELLERVFHCPVYDSYRTREVGPIGQECEFHDGMHVNAECLHVEVEPQDGSEGSALGRILVTDLLNHGMPFVRYEIGDIGMLASRPCPCGRGLPRLQQMGGRLADATYTRDGRAISSIALVANLVHGLIWTRVQIIQEAFDRLQIRIEPPAPPAEILARQRSVAETIFGTPLEVTQEIVDRIPLEKSGKYRYIICKIPESQLERRRRGGSDPSAEGS